MKKLIEKKIAYLYALLPATWHGLTSTKCKKTNSSMRLLLCYDESITSRRVVNSSITQLLCVLVKKSYPWYVSNLLTLWVFAQKIICWSLHRSFCVSIQPSTLEVALNLVSEIQINNLYLFPLVIILTVDFH